MNKEHSISITQVARETASSCAGCYQDNDFGWSQYENNFQSTFQHLLFKRFMEATGCPPLVTIKPVLKRPEFTGQPEIIDFVIEP